MSQILRNFEINQKTEKIKRLKWIIKKHTKILIFYSDRGYEGNKEY